MAILPKPQSENNSVVKSSKGEIMADSAERPMTDTQKLLRLESKVMHRISRAIDELPNDKSKKRVLQHMMELMECPTNGQPASSA